jgi:hypothetical protein
MQWLAIAAIVLSARVAASGPSAGCDERSEVVGLHRCRGFGEWSAHGYRWPISFEVGYLHHGYPGAPFAFDTSARLDGQQHSLPTVTDGPVFRALYGLHPWLYLGLEYGMGFFGQVAAPSGGAQIDVLNTEVLALGGARVYYTRLALSAELAAGARDTQFSQDPGTAYVVQWRRELEARIRFDVFTDVHYTIGVVYGRSLIDARDSCWTINFGFHSRALDGFD